MKTFDFVLLVADRGPQASMLVTPSRAFDAHRAAIRSVVVAHQARNPRVFGSVARGDDSEQSDLDLLFDTTGGTRLFDIAAIELELERLLGVSVHVTTSVALRGALERDRLRLL
jgi:predicted nucleotidyltransferase